MILLKRGAGERKEAGRRLRPVVVLALILAMGGVGGCAGLKTEPVTIPEPVIAPPSAPESVGPTPGEREMTEAMEALEAGRLDAAARRFEAILQGGAGSPERAAASYGLGLLLARPDHAGRDVGRARTLLSGYLQSGAPAVRATAARLVLSLLDAEAVFLAQIAELRGRVAGSGAETEDLRVALAQREAELRRIKEILLGGAGGS